MGREDGGKGEWEGGEEGGGRGRGGKGERKGEVVLNYIKVLNFFISLARQTDSKEHQIIRRQLAVKDENSTSFTITVRKTLQKYQLPDAYSLIEKTPTKSQWKKMIKEATNNIYTAKITEEIKTKSTMKYLGIQKQPLDNPHPIYKFTGPNPFEYIAQLSEEICIIQIIDIPLAMDRVVALVDMDCFYVQVEQRLNPEFKGKPCAVVQYKTWKGGGIIAVGYEARACGVTRNMWGDEAKKKCPNIHFFRVPEVRGKADLTKFREAGAEVIAVLSKFSGQVERASIDEAYIDLTEEVKKRITKLSGDRVLVQQLQNTFVVGHGDDKSGESREEGVDQWLTTAFEEEVSDNDIRLAVGALISEEMRAAVYAETGFRCSAGIAHNKMLAKLSCGLHKPNKQTVLPHASVPILYSTLPIKKIRNLGGKFGQSLVEQLGVENIGDLCKFSLKELQACCGDKSGMWLYDVCRGIEYEPVSARQLPKSIGCSKNFPGKTCLDTREKVKHWLGELAGEVAERLVKDRETNLRMAKSMTVYVRYMGTPSQTASRACAITQYKADKIANNAFALLQQFNLAPAHQPTWTPPILCLGISASKFIDESAGNNSSITSFLGSQKSKLNNDLLSSQFSPKKSIVRGPRRGSIQSFFSQTSTQRFQETINTSSYNSENDDIADGASSETLKNIPLSKEPVAGPSALKTLDNNVLDRRSENGSNRMGFFVRKMFEIQQAKKEKGEDSHDHRRNSNNIEVMNSFMKKYTVSEQNGKLDGERTEDLNIVENVTTRTSDEDLKRSISSPSKRMQSVSEDIIEYEEPEPVPGTSYNEEITARRLSEMHATEEGTSRRPSELYDIDPNSVDSDVFDALPLDIQNEIKAEMGRQNGLKSPIKTSALPQENDGNCDIENAATNGDLFTSCEKCGKKLQVWEMEEHMDFHFAQELQQEFRQSDAPLGTSNRSENNRQSVGAGTKRKLGAATSTRGRKKQKPNVDKCQRMDNFIIKR
ncbi:hypothetical protein FSP39_001859 [Pinctada imbricata]|uniref:DNA polymerase eta n=1 Tax=Pinctada imbricata TaxID=66713 RepID=A0AA88XV07_PINIB|nr:hypothetical protein FSP39_001859 [Pinctada imbricata]